MCGIVGYIGARPAVPILLEGLEKLEYRGYDSAGVAVCDGKELRVVKKEGKLTVLKEEMAGTDLPGTVGIGHTRWATHGRPSDINSHPHWDCRGRIAVVHNGIIENYLELKEELLAKGHKFASETDTEVIPHLIEEYYNGDIVEAVRQTVARLHGSYALVVLCEDEPDKLVAARKDSPLVVGLGEGEYFLASDIPAILGHTRRTYILEDGEMVVVNREGVLITDAAGNPVEREVFEVKWDAVAAEKGGYPHFMLKEIHEQPRALRDTLSGRLKEDGRVNLAELEPVADRLACLQRMYIVACGTAYHAGVVGKYVIEKMARLPVEVDIASEFRYRDPILGPEDLLVVISQSGETADTLAALREAKKRGATVVAVTNVVGSSVSREADAVLYTWAGPEIAVASTKAYTTQLLLMFLLALQLAEIRGRTTPECGEIVEAIHRLPAAVEAVLSREEEIKAVADDYCRSCASTFFIGRGLDYAVAMEGALKLKEISYIHAEAYAAGELKHGTLALIEEGVPVIALATQPDLFEKTLSNIKEVKARAARVLALAVEGNRDIEKEADRVFYLPALHPLVLPVVTVVPLQLLAYYAAVARGCDVDKPRNLAKSVTVE
ncbi:MAG: hypothetical protein PWQ91_629 [Eubacteriales bacterium]|nr:hypothetical protein [Eubacteriales bacterium]MDN5363568.1 hypothetical protein [Eubacteriales bacterium]